MAFTIVDPGTAGAGLLSEADLERLENDLAASIRANGHIVIVPDGVVGPATTIRNCDLGALIAEVRWRRRDLVATKPYGVVED